LPEEVRKKLKEDEEYKSNFRTMLERKIHSYTSEKDAREIVHNAYYAVLVGLTTDKLTEHLAGFRSELADLMFSKKGVVSAMHFYEQAILRIREENGGYIPEKEVIGEPDKKKEGRAEELTRRYLRATVPNLEKWEEDRAIAIARGMSIIIGRAVEIAATSILPPEGGLISLYAQDLIKDLAPFRHLIGKYNLGEKANKVFGYLLNKRKRAWSYEELEDLEKKEHSYLLEVVDGLVSEEDERYLSVLNPLKVGSLFTRSTWRVANPSGENPIPSLLENFSREELKWIGTGGDY
jgi:hypothetical protein